MRWTTDETTLDLDVGEITSGDEVTTLSPLESRLLRYLAARPGQVIPTTVLLREVWGYSPRVQTRALAKTLHRLRAKLEADPAHPTWLHTLRGQGVRFTPPSGGQPRAAQPPMLGRGSEQEALRAWLSGPEQLLTLLGPGGMGKTRLAQWAADVAAERLVGFCVLDGVTERARLLERISAVLGVPLSEIDDGIVIAQHLARQQRPLLVLDNLEESVEVAAPLIATWLQQSRVQILVTSRQRLRLPSEAVTLLAPLSEDASVALLSERGGWPDDGALRSLASSLEGIPLALELAAAHGPLLPAAVVEGRLSALLAAPRPLGVERHQTMTAAVGWSWRRLTAAEQQALARVSVCGGPVSLETAEAVVDRPDALSLLLLLVERSLLRWEGTALTMYEVIRQFAREHLTAADTEAALARLGWDIAHRGLAARESADTGEGDQALEAVASMPAILTAWDAALRGTDGTLVCWLAYLIGQQRFGRVHPARIRPDLRRALAHGEATPEAQSRVRYVLARSAALVGDYAEADAHFQAILADAQARGDIKLERLTCCAIVQHHQPGRDRLADARRAVAVCAGDEARMLPAALSILGLVLHRQGDLDGAAEAYRRAEELFEAHKQAIGVLRVLCLRAGLPMSPAQRRELVARLQQRAGPPTDSLGAMVSMVLGEKLLELGEAARAYERLTLAGEHHQRSGDHIDQVVAYEARGTALLLLGEAQRGTALLEEALALAQAIESYQIPGVQARLGVARLLAGRLADARELLEASSLPPDWKAAYLIAAGSPDTPALRASLTDPTFAALLSDPPDAGAVETVSELFPMGPLLLRALGH